MIHARLSPAYDIVSTLPYVQGENGIALNLGTQNAWYGINLATFQAWSQRVGISWPAVKVHVLDALDRARETWPQLLQDLPMKESHTAVLKDHWSKLSDDFKFD